MAHVITVEELKVICEYEMQKGNGKKKIMLSDDEEGNGYHSLFFAFTEIKDGVLDYTYVHDCSKEEAVKEYIILG